ncbi:ROK family transcriptional regulator [Demequina sp.]|uniref:ROK family transcriptional regulator n=1 Tax=Demequina sp. TaxID=2050685 RepID=UPI0025C3CFC0|nr:ROK family transcriptional regulator [Demequina sp.]
MSDRTVRGSRNEETRRRNLSLVLSAVHAGGELTRSDLTRLSGLNRSTVGALVGDLVSAGLVVEAEPRATHQAGRPSPVVRPSSDVVAVSVNPDVAGVVCAVVGLGGEVRLRETILTPEHLTPEDTALLTKDFLEKVSKEFPSTTRVVGVGVAIPGIVDEQRNTVREAPHLKWRDVPLVSLIEEEVTLPVRMANDATLGVMAESMFGAGAGFDDVVYLNGSVSGLGGGVVSGGHLVKGVRGFGAELGHILINPQGAVCACGRLGCLETEVNIQRIWAVSGEGQVGIDDLDHLYAQRASAALNTELDRQADALAAGIASLLNIFAPARVILGGHVGALFEARSDRIHEGVTAQALAPVGEEASLVRNVLRERMVPIGSAQLAFGPLLADPVNTSLFEWGSRAAVAN